MKTRTCTLAVAALVGLGGCAPQLPVNDGRINTARNTASAPSATVSAAPGSTPTASESPTADACVTLAGALSVEERVGQLYMVGVSTSGLDETTRAAIRDNKVGSVVLLGNTTSGSAQIRLLTAELTGFGSDQLPLLVSVDQEGGTVQRLQGEGFTRIPSAREQAELPDGELAKQSATWAAELKEAGVDYNLAPVADVVPVDRRNTNAPIGKLKRDYGSEPVTVGAKVTEFIDGMHEAGVLTSVKHFPGLGQVEVNTDFGVARDTAVTADSDVIGPFRTAIEAGADSVMVSSAIFTKIDPDNEGVFSSAIVTDLLRGTIGYTGVVIADDLGAAAAVKGVKPEQRGIKFIEAGGDLAINADPSLMTGMVQETIERAESDEAFSQRVTESAARVLNLKEKAGLIQCG